MQSFHCNHCDQVIFFESVSCVNCGRLLAYLADRQTMGSLVQAGDALWRYRERNGAEFDYRLCENYAEHNVCNWAVPHEDEHAACISCRLTQPTPELQEEAHQQAWFRLEAAKRRLIYTLMQLRLPIHNKLEDADSGLAFEFKAEKPGSQVLTGHANGLITINIAETDDAQREQRRTALHEPYRTLLGHFRHEIGHYYWDRLIAHGERLESFRALFGDERQDYAEALKLHYANGARADWQTCFVSAYASSHPWEDWAESWAHYLHMIDVTETAVSCGLALKPQHPKEPLLQTDPKLLRRRAFEDAIDAWFSLTYVLNNLNRSLGLPDAYPFVLSTPAIDKLHFIHDAIEEFVAPKS